MDIASLPVGAAPKALALAHFPVRFQAVIWRNWNIVGVERIAKVLGATSAQILASAEAMGLHYDPSAVTRWAERGYLTVIRANWQLLDYPQLLELLDWTADQLDFTLREDDFMWVKMGRLKPECGKVLWRELTAEEAAATAELRRIVGALPAPEGKALPFDFLDRYGTRKPLTGRKPDGLRMIYSYSALYGDPLMNESCDPYPDALLADYAASGVNAIWMQGLLYALTPWLGEGHPLSENWRERQTALRRLAKRAEKFGIRIYLYINEPRALPPRCFEQFPDWGGAISTSSGLQAFCPHQPAMLDALGAGIEALCRAVPELGGFFTISMSENLTHCLSRPTEKPCPVCQGQSPAWNVAAVLNAIHSGVKRSGTGAELIAWSWGWSTDWDADVLAALAPEVKIMCVSETGVETDYDGIKGRIIDYSIAHPGPGPVAKRLWNLAREHGHEVIAKVQINCTWEMSAMPFVPVPQLVERHLNALREAGVHDFMLSWTLGGCPGGNLELLQMPLTELATRKFGDAAPEVLRAYEAFSHGFERFPFNGTSLIYTGPQTFGSANLLYAEPSGYAATMVGFPFDDITSWGGGAYSPEVLEKAFGEMADDWRRGLEILADLPASPALDELRTVAEAVYCHLRSSALQLTFIRRRGEADWQGREVLLMEEETLALRLLDTMTRDSRIGFEASNHYMYTRNDLLEKVLNCRACQR